jgi:hypothetical protein
VVPEPKDAGSDDTAGKNGEPKDAAKAPAKKAPPPPKKK